MSGRLKVFISSTMRDLVNERAEVIQRLEELNLEPVSAENMTPTGEDSWDRLTSAIEECDLFVLVLGESYGWIPDSGPMAEEGKSVTALEFEVARVAGIPILVFVKNLGLHAAADTEDAHRREAFRAEVESWDGGIFRAQFELARDLAENVGRSVAELITDRFRAAELMERREAMPRSRENENVRTPEPVLPHDLVEAVARRSVVLLLGAGASLEAGMPSAAMFIEAMAREIRSSNPDYAPGFSGTTFNAVATDFESLRGDTELRELARELVEPGFATPTAAHRIAGQLFDTILTTNYDLLLERSLSAEGRQFRIVDGEASAKDLEEPLRLIKLHGSIDHPGGLILTETQLANLERNRPKLWASLVELLSDQPLLAIGSSLRDPSLIRLLEESRPNLHGWAVLREATEAERLRLERWNLEIVRGDANGVLSALEKQVTSLRATKDKDH